MKVYDWLHKNYHYHYNPENSRNIIVAAGLFAAGKGFGCIGIDYFVRAQRFDLAAPLAEKIGDLEMAIGLYEKAKMFDEGIGLAERKGDKDKVINLYKGKIMYLKWKGKHSEGAELALKNLPKAEGAKIAIELYKEALDFDKAANLGPIAGISKEIIYRDGIKYYEHSNMFDEAIKLAKKISDDKEIIRLLKKQSEYYKQLAEEERRKAEERRILEEITAAG